MTLGKRCCEFLKKMFRKLFMPQRTSGKSEHPAEVQKPENGNEITSWKPAEKILPSSSSEKFERPDMHGAAEESASISAVAVTEVFFTHEWLLANKVLDGINPQLHEFIQDRIEQIREAEGDDIQWCIETVDFMDELRMMEPSYSTRDKEAADFISGVIRKKCASLKIELIDHDEWTPTEQRALSLTRTPNADKARILRKGATGLRREGELIRKQEVILELPEQKGDEKYV